MGGNAIASVRLFPIYLWNKLTVDLELLHASRSWPQLSRDWRSRSWGQANAVGPTSIVGSFSSFIQASTATAHTLRGWASSLSQVYRKTFKRAELVRCQLITKWHSKAHYDYCPLMFNQPHFPGWLTELRFNSPLNKNLSDEVLAWLSIWSEV